MTLRWRLRLCESFGNFGLSDGIVEKSGENKGLSVGAAVWLVPVIDV